MKTLLRRSLLLIPGSAILAFGLYHIHSISGITEGGILGATLLLFHHFGISPALSGLVLNGLCYLLGFFLLGKGFILYSAIAGAGFSLFYAIFESFPPIYPEISSHPLAAALLGALFVGIGVGLCVRAGGAPSGDDALAMSLSKAWKRAKLQHVYLASDLLVLGLSLTYIPPEKILYSLLTCVLSGQIIGWVSAPRRERKSHGKSK